MLRFRPNSRVLMEDTHDTGWQEAWRLQLFCTDKQRDVDERYLGLWRVRGFPCDGEWRCARCSTT